MTNGVTSFKVSGCQLGSIVIYITSLFLNTTEERAGPAQRQPGVRALEVLEDLRALGRDFRQALVNCLGDDRLLQGLREAVYVVPVLGQNGLRALLETRGADVVHHAEGRQPEHLLVRSGGAANLLAHVDSDGLLHDFRENLY